VSNEASTTIPTSPDRSAKLHRCFMESLIVHCRTMACTYTDRAPPNDQRNLQYAAADTSDIISQFIPDPVPLHSPTHLLMFTILFTCVSLSSPGSRCIANWDRPSATPIRDLSPIASFPFAFCLVHQAIAEEPGPAQQTPPFDCPSRIPDGPSASRPRLVDSR
jgi:hypothetical protein